jgi:aspartyl-tRNA(Asn)/glutamyl-tRNA(Gln) amidotransferase subunit A
VTEEQALADARRAEAEIGAGRRLGPLHGVPYALKDNIDVAGLPTTAHSALLSDNIAGANAGVVDRLQAAGMILLGKQSLHEFARGGPTDRLPWPNALNPWALDYGCGGSSSGSAVSVASGMAPLAIGTDTGGSVRFPAACTGIVGMKPTYGLVSRRGVFPLSFSLDGVGPLTRTVADNALALRAMAGFDYKDPGSARATIPDFAAGLDGGIEGLRVGLLAEYNRESGIDGEMTAAVDAAGGVLRNLGAHIEEARLPPRRRFDAATWTIMLAEGLAIHADMLRRRFMDYGRTARERISIGAFVTGEHLVQAQRWRAVLTQSVESLFDRFDVLVCATANGAPPPLSRIDDGPWRKTHPITAPFNLTGHPALAVPAGFASNGLPLSIQIVGRHFGEAAVFRTGHAYEQAAGWHRRRPPDRVA